MKKIILILMVFLGVCSCKKTIITLPSESAPVLIAVKSAPIGAGFVASRAKSSIYDSFGTGSQIGIYTTAAPSVDLNVANHINIGYSNVQLETYWSANSADQAIYYLENNGEMNFFAYHPYTGQSNSTVSLLPLSVAPTLEYTMPLNQSTDAVLLTADLMWGNAMNVKESDNNNKVEIGFSHKLTKLTLNVILGDDWGVDKAQLSQVKVYGAPVLRNARLNLGSGELTVLPNATGVLNSVECVLAIPQLLSKLNTESFDFIVLPTDDIDGLTLEFVVNGMPYRKVLTSTNLPDPANRTFMEATNRVFGVKINRYDPDQLSVIPSIVSWNVVSEIDIEGL